jgi:hypothetical protein
MRKHQKDWPIIYLRLIKMCSDARNMSEKNKKESPPFFAGYIKSKDELTAQPRITGPTLISLFKTSANNSSEIPESEPLIIEY